MASVRILSQDGQRSSARGRRGGNADGVGKESAGSGAGGNGGLPGKMSEPLESQRVPEGFGLGPTCGLAMLNCWSRAELEWPGRGEADRNVVVPPKAGQCLGRGTGRRWSLWLPTLLLLLLLKPRCVLPRRTNGWVRALVMARVVRGGDWRDAEREVVRDRQLKLFALGLC